MDQFDAYFRRADLDGDGRISGAEAVAFFQGSNLPQHVLAQVPHFSLSYTIHLIYIGDFFLLIIARMGENWSLNRGEHSCLKHFVEYKSVWNLSREVSVDLRCAFLR